MHLSPGAEYPPASMSPLAMPKHSCWTWRTVEAGLSPSPPSVLLRLAAGSSPPPPSGALLSSSASSMVSSSPLLSPPAALAAAAAPSSWLLVGESSRAAGSELYQKGEKSEIAGLSLPDQKRLRFQKEKNVLFRVHCTRVTRSDRSRLRLALVGKVTSQLSPERQVPSGSLSPYLSDLAGVPDLAEAGLSGDDDDVAAAAGAAAGEEEAEEEGAAGCIR